MKKTKKALAALLALAMSVTSMTSLISSAEENTFITDPDDPNYQDLVDVSYGIPIHSEQDDYKDLSQEQFLYVSPESVPTSVENVISFLGLSDDEVRAKVLECKKYNEANKENGSFHGINWSIEFRKSPQYMKIYKQYIPGLDTGDHGSLGDVNGDFRIDSQDALRVLEFIVGLDYLQRSYLEGADVNKDNIVTIDDALQILRYTTGVIDEF